MNDQISVFKGIHPDPIAETSWQEALARMQSDRYRDSILKARDLAKQDADKYRQYKTKLPAVTFGGTFQKRNRQSITAPTGFLIPDLDHLEDVEGTFKKITADPHAWFCFRSPSGDGLKFGLRADWVKTDTDTKKFFLSAERYLEETHGLKIDQACKDICRLSFLSWDPGLWINPDPVLFDVSKWSVVDPPAPQYKDIAPTGRENAYALKVLESVCNAIATASDGDKHSTRLRKAKLIGGYMPYLDEHEVLYQIEQALFASGTKNIGQAMKTVRDGIEYGRQNPIAIALNSAPSDYHPADRTPDIEYDLYTDPDDDFSDCHPPGNQIVTPVTPVTPVTLLTDCNACNTPVTLFEKPVTLCNAPVTPVTLSQKQKADDSKQTLANAIKEFIVNSKGSFTTRDIDSELCLRTRQEKSARRVHLHRYINKKLIIKDERKPGLYHILENNIEWIDYNKKTEESFPINMPFDLHRFVLIPPKAIIIIAGSSNAGKTAFILNTLRLNFNQKHDLVYLMSEMGDSEFLTRARGIAPIQEWSKVKAASKSYQFAPIVGTHNPNGLTAVDFLEEVDGEYFKVASNIREIYDALDQGVVLIAIQKKTDSNYGRGGQATAEKARLYMTLDYLATQQNAIVCALKIVKVKHYLGRNLQNHEIHFRISRGSHIEALTDWLNSNQVDRVAYAKAYEQGKSIIDDPGVIQDMFFRLTDAPDGRIAGKQIQQWIDSFPNIAVYEELKRIRADCDRKPWMIKKGYFHQLAAMLAKRNEAAGF